MSSTKTRPVHPNGRSADLTRFKGVVLDIGCGRNKEPGAVGMDSWALPGVDVVHDWTEYPWPFRTNSVLTIVARNVVACVDPAYGGFIRWMNECWRILKPDRQMLIETPYPDSPDYRADPTYVNECSERTWWYFAPAVNAERLDGTTWTPYAAYEPAPWHIESMFFQHGGVMEVVLRKLEDQADWHANGKVHYR